MKIYDCFLFCDELDMLECRLREYENTAIYRHVIVEAPLTHRGPGKTLNYAEHKDRYAPWADRITYVVASGLNPAMPWPDRIAEQREAVRYGLEDAEPDDIVILSDLDEIISPAGVQVAARGEHVYFRQRLALFCADWEAPRLWDGPAAARRRDISGFSGFRISGRAVTEGAGWHLSWFGGPAAVLAKMGRYGHSEQDAMLADGVRSGRFLLRGDTWEGQCSAVNITDEWPRWIFERKCPPQWFREHWAEGRGDMEQVGGP